LVRTVPPELLDLLRQLAANEAGDLKASSVQLSEHYRARGRSAEVVTEMGQAVAYALTRMPATYAAVSEVVDEVFARAPGWAADVMLDVGAGPGTATWAVAEMYPGIEAVLVDHNPTFRTLAKALAKEVPLGPSKIRDGDLARFDLGRQFDLVTCAYALTELGDAAIFPAAERLWTHTAGILIIVEPGRPRDYQRLMDVRARLVELGGSILAPCPHDAPCPLVAPDWCHFSVRLNRSREHMRMKGGTLGYEDEKYSYLVVARPGIGKRTPARVIRPPEENKFSVSLPLCTPNGTELRVVPSRDKVVFKAARKLGWGDSVEISES